MRTRPLTSCTPCENTSHTKHTQTCLHVHRLRTYSIYSVCLCVSGAVLTDKLCVVSCPLVFRYSRGVMSPGRHVRTRLYFTSESHVHSLLSIFRYGGLLDVRADFYHLCSFFLCLLLLIFQNKSRSRKSQLSGYNESFSRAGLLDGIMNGL